MWTSLRYKFNKMKIYRKIAYVENHWKVLMVNDSLQPPGSCSALGNRGGTQRSDNSHTAHQEKGMRQGDQLENPPNVGIKGLDLLIHMLRHLHKLIFNSYVFIFSNKFFTFYFINIKFTNIGCIAFYIKFYISVSMLHSFHPFLNEFAILSRWHQWC